MLSTAEAKGSFEAKMEGSRILSNLIIHRHVLGVDCARGVDHPSLPHPPLRVTPTHLPRPHLHARRIFARKPPQADDKPATSWADEADAASDRSKNPTPEPGTLSPNSVINPKGRMS